MPPRSAFALDAALLSPGVRALIAMARAALWLERLWPLIAPPVLILALFLGLAAVGLWQWTGGIVRLAVLVGLFGWAALRLWQTRALLVWPSMLAGLLRLDRQNGLADGLLASVLDRPMVLANGRSQALWQHHMSQRAGLLPRLRPVLPRLSLLVADRFALLPLTVLLLVLGFIASPAGWSDRLLSALSPDWRSFAGVSVTASISPPAYVQAPPQTVALAIDEPRALAAHQGATLVVTAAGLARAPTLRLPDGQRLILQPDGPERWRATAPVGEGGDVRLRTWMRTLAHAQISLIRDKAPQVAWTKVPTVTANQSLDLRYRITDDHGANALALAFSRGGRWRAVALTPPPLTPGAIEGQAFRDLTEEAWAGKLVTVQLVARDPAGNLGFSQPVAMRLPERVFTHPLAREVAGVRRQLLAGQVSALMAGLAIERLSAAPERFGHDLTVFLGLRGAVHRLELDRGPGGIAAGAALLWQVALDLDGQQAAAGLEDVRRAFEALMNGMQSPDEARRLADQLERALGDFLQQRMAEAMSGPQLPADGSTAVLDAAILDELFAALKERLAAGDVAGAQQIAAALQQLMEQIRFSPPVDLAAERAALQQLEALQQLLGQQKALNERTQKGGAMVPLAGEQRQLGQAAGRLDGGAGAKAAAAMTRAAAALARQDRTGAAAAQMQALDALTEAARMAQQQVQAMRGGRRPGAAPPGVDPLGRLGPGAFDGRVRNLVPDQSAAERVRAIRRIIEERAADPARPQAERDYLLRLLERF